MIRMLSKIKSAIIPKGRAPRKSIGGLLSGLIMNFDLAFEMQSYLGLFERELHSFIRKLSKDIDTAIDIGAAEGEYTLFFLAKTSAKKVLAFEPIEWKQELLLKNLKLNGLNRDKLVLSPKFISSENSENSITLDSIIGSFSLPCLIKIDVDGGEEDILKGAGKFLQQPGIRFVIETHSKVLEDHCIKILKDSGYSVRIIDKAWWRIFVPELRPLQHNRWFIAAKDLRI